MNHIKQVFSIIIFIFLCINFSFAMYDTHTGRFMQQDPLGIQPEANTKINPFKPPIQYSDGLNLYQAVASNPSNNDDEYGLKKKKCPLSLWGTDSDRDYSIAWRKEIKKRGEIAQRNSFNIQRLKGDYMRIGRRMKRECCECYSSVTIYDHGNLMGKGTLNYGVQYYGGGGSSPTRDKRLKGSDIRKLCPYLCENTTLILEGCFVGSGDREGFAMLFGGCSKITKIKACRDTTEWLPGVGKVRCNGGYKTFSR